jgi:hypothetical protein
MGSWGVALTDRERFNLAELKKELFRRCDYTCAVCGGSIYQYGTPQLAHRIAQTESNIKKYGKKVIHHKKNLVSVCCLACNDACNIGHKLADADRLAAEIMQEVAK